jgi:hypothetical protein
MPLMPIAAPKEYEDKALRKNDVSAQQNPDALEDIQPAKKTKPSKAFQKAYNELIQNNVYDNSMVSKADIERAKKGSEPKPTLEEVAARLWACHDKHLMRVENLRQEMEQERFKKGGDLNQISEECKF